jgi:hypothetical protein
MERAILGIPFSLERRNAPIPFYSDRSVPHWVVKPYGEEPNPKEYMHKDTRPEAWDELERYARINPESFKKCFGRAEANLAPSAPAVEVGTVFEFRVVDGDDDLWGSVRIEAPNEGAARIDLDDFLQKEIQGGGDIDLATVKLTLVSPTQQERPRWVDKANGIISTLCKESYAKANINPDGTKRKRHVPYAVPPLAQALVECLGTCDEERAKALFQAVHDFPELSRGD